MGCRGSVYCCVPFSYGASDPMSFKGRATYQQWDGAASRARASHFSYGAQRCANFSARKLPGPKDGSPSQGPGQGPKVQARGAGSALQVLGARPRPRQEPSQNSTNSQRTASRPHPWREDRVKATGPQVNVVDFAAPAHGRPPGIPEPSLKPQVTA